MQRALSSKPRTYGSVDMNVSADPALSLIAIVLIGKGSKTGLNYEVEIKVAGIIHLTLFYLIYSSSSILGCD